MLLSVTPHVTGTLSVLGSAYIIYDIASDRKKWSSPYYRLLFAMGVVDFLSSFATSLSTVPMPAGTDVYHSYGNSASCKAQGFFIHFNIASPLYNLMLSIYFLLTVTFEWSKDDIKKRVEIWLHAIPLVWSFTTALVVLIANGFTDTGLWCWIDSTPKDCLDKPDVECEYCRYCKKYFWMSFFYGPLWIAAIGTMVIMIILVHSVRKTEKKAAKWRPERVRSKVKKEASAHSRSVVVESSNHSRTATDSMDTSRSASQENNISNFLETKETQAPDISNLNAPESRNPDRRSTLRSLKELTSRLSSVSVDGTTKSAWRESITKLFDSEEKRARKKELRMTRLVTRQAFLYCLVFWITWSFGTVNRVLQMINHSYFAVMFFHAMFTPMQGFLNFIVYNSIRVQKWWKEKKTSRPGPKATGNRSRRNQENDEKSPPAATTNVGINFATSDHCIDIGEDDL